MKKMTCEQLGGACELEFHAETFEEIAALSKQHAAKMLQANDEAHTKTMQSMMAILKVPEAMGRWLNAKRQEFDGLPLLSTTK
jgi:hypothetical protein